MGSGLPAGAAVGGVLGAAAAGGRVWKVTRGAYQFGPLPPVSRVLNSGAGHAANRAMERGLGFASRKEAVEELRALRVTIGTKGWPDGSLLHHNGREVNVPFGTGYVTYKQSKGTARAATSIDYDKAHKHSPD